MLYCTGVYQDGIRPPSPPPPRTAATAATASAAAGLVLQTDDLADAGLLLLVLEGADLLSAGPPLLLGRGKGFLAQFLDRLCCPHGTRSSGLVGQQDLLPLGGCASIELAQRLEGSRVRCGVFCCRRFFVLFLFFFFFFCCCCCCRRCLGFSL